MIKGIGNKVNLTISLIAILGGVALGIGDAAEAVIVIVILHAAAFGIGDLAEAASLPSVGEDGLTIGILNAGNIIIGAIAEADSIVIAIMVRGDFTGHSIGDGIAFAVIPLPASGIAIAIFELFDKKTTVKDVDTAARTLKRAATTVDGFDTAIQWIEGEF